MEDSLDAWFAREILSHEESFVRYLTRVWPNRDDIHDLRQEVYIKVYEAAVRGRPQSPKSFMFTTARNLMADRIRRSRIVSIEATADLDALNVLVDEISPEQKASARQELGRLAQALDLLPPQCRNVMWMRKVEGISQKEVAEALGITEGAVEKHIAKGVRLLAKALFGGDARQAASLNEQEAGHGKRRSD